MRGVRSAEYRAQGGEITMSRILVPKKAGAELGGAPGNTRSVRVLHRTNSEESTTSRLNESTNIVNVYDSIITCRC